MSKENENAESVINEETGPEAVQAAANGVGCGGCLAGAEAG